MASLVAAEAAEHLRAHRMPEMECGQRVAQLIDLGERSGGALHPSERDGSVQSNDGRGVPSHQHVVEREDLQPVGLLGRRGVRVAGGDRGLQLKAARALLLRARAS